jgi:predicted anti-sigma-YlaC factor YlaD
VDVLDGALPDGLRLHLDTCEACRNERDHVVALAASAKAAAEEDLPDPPPFFWERLSANIRRETTAAAPMRWQQRWHKVWPSLATLGVTAAAALVVFVLRAPVRAPASTETHTAPGAAAVTPVDDQADWALVVQRTSALSQDDVDQVASSVPTLGNAVQLDELTPAERATFVRLVKSEMGGSE